MSEESAKSSLLAKGRIAVWLIIITTAVLTYKGCLTGDQFLDVIKMIGGFWLGAEAGARGLDK